MLLTVDDQRIAHLDGLRTVAILWVMLFHFSVFWSSAGNGQNLLPYDDALASIPLASVGYYGVSLFFCISGMVIMATLTRTRNLGTFAVSRLFRLFPTLILCGSITFAATSMLGPPELVRSLPEYFISLMFLPPQHLGNALGLGQLQWLDGAYWSLWTEVRFYAIIGVLYFVLGTRVLLGWAAFVVLSFAIQVFALYSGDASADLIAGLLFAEYQPFFTVGIALFLLSNGHNAWLAKAMLGVSILQAAFLDLFVPFVWLPAGPGEATEALITATGLAAVFALAAAGAFQARLLDPLASRVPTVIGQASYPYYLLHQNFGLALLVWVSFNPEWLSIGAMIVIQASIVFLSIIIHKRFEVGFVAPLKRQTLQRIGARQEARGAGGTNAAGRVTVKK